MFDLADITWFPFGPFFGATLIGKSIAKMHIQVSTVYQHMAEMNVQNVLHTKLTFLMYFFVMTKRLLRSVV